MLIKSVNEIIVLASCLWYLFSFTGVIPLSSKYFIKLLWNVSMAVLCCRKSFYKWIVSGDSAIVIGFTWLVSIMFSVLHKFLSKMCIWWDNFCVPPPINHSFIWKYTIKYGMLWNHKVNKMKCWITYQNIHFLFYLCLSVKVCVRLTLIEMTWMYGCAKLNTCLFLFKCVVFGFFVTAEGLSRSMFVTSKPYARNDGAKWCFLFAHVNFVGIFVSFVMISIKKNFEHCGTSITEYTRVLLRYWRHSFHLMAFIFLLCIHYLLVWRKKIHSSVSPVKCSSSCWLTWLLLNSCHKTTSSPRCEFALSGFKKTSLCFSSRQQAFSITPLHE